MSVAARLVLSYLGETVRPVCWHEQDAEQDDR
jgi:hypothetical protein